jgi:hypothetical protein
MFDLRVATMGRQIADHPGNALLEHRQDGGRAKRARSSHYAREALAIPGRSAEFLSAPRCLGVRRE